MRVLVLLCLLVAELSAQAVPDHVLVGYWHNWAAPQSGYRLAQVPPQYDVVNVAFATPTVPGGVDLRFQPDRGLYPNPQDFLGDVRTLQARGTKVLISIGGAADPIHVDTPADAQILASSLLQIVASHGFDGVDIDLEGSSLSVVSGDLDFRAPTSPRIVHFIAAMRTVTKAAAADFLLTAAPGTAFVQGGQSAYGGVWGAYLPVLHALRDQLDWVQVQHYNTGSMFGRDGRIYQPATGDFHVAMADALIAGFPVAGGGGSFPPLRPDQVVIGLPATVQAAGSGYTGAGVIDGALQYLAHGLRPAGVGYQLADPRGHTDFRGLMLWSVNWDQTVGHAYSVALRRSLDELHQSPRPDSLVAAQGGRVDFDLRAGRRLAGLPYALVATVSGMAPGTALPAGRHHDINLDWFTNLSLSGAPAFVGFLGVLGADGRASASMTLPPLPAAAGTTIDGALLVPWGLATQPLPVTLR